MAQVYRDIQIGTVWEGSGNVAALDVLRILAREPAALTEFLDECEAARGADPRLDAHLDRVRSALGDPPSEWGARRLVEDLALAFAASLLTRHAPSAVADGFCASRLGGGGRVFGTLPAGVDTQAIVDRALAA